MTVDSLRTELPHISVVICTRNRPATIGHAVRSVLQGDYPKFDVVVVDQSTSEETARHIAVLERADERLQYLHDCRPGAARARNLGIKATAGEIIAFTDDDCVVPITWLSNIAKVFTDDLAIDLLYGQVLPPRLPTIEGGVTPALRLTHVERYAQGNLLRGGWAIFGGMSANFAARRRVFEQIGLFDEMLGVGAPLLSGEDFDLTYRALRAGCVIVRHPEVCVVHEFGTRSLDTWAATTHYYGMGDGAFYWKHVRCRDPFMFWLVVRRVAEFGLKEAAKRYVLHRAASFAYVRGLLEGIVKSTRFPVDRSARLYEPLSPGTVES